MGGLKIGKKKRGIRGLRRQSDTIIFFFQYILSISFVFFENVIHFFCFDPLIVQKIMEILSASNECTKIASHNSRPIATSTLKFIMPARHQYQ